MLGLCWYSRASALFVFTQVVSLPDVSIIIGEQCRRYVVLILALRQSSISCTKAPCNGAYDSYFSMECTRRDNKHFEKSLSALHLCSAIFCKAIKNTEWCVREKNKQTKKQRIWKTALKLSGAVSNDDCSKLARNDGQGGSRFRSAVGKICSMYAGAVCTICVCQNSKHESFQCQC